MNQPMTTDKPLKMTSREIAELVEKRHDNVKRTIETLVQNGVISSPQFEEKPTGGRPLIEYSFKGEQGKRDTYVVVAQLSPQFTARLVDRWQELESQALQVPKTLPDALRLAADLAEQKQAAEGEVKRLQSVCETITNQFTPGLTPPQFARMLNGVNIRAIQGWMAQQGMLYQANHGYMAMSRYRDSWFVQKVSDPRGAEIPGRPYVTLTLQGAKAIYKRYLRGDLPMKATWDGKYTHDLFDLKQVA